MDYSPIILIALVVIIGLVIYNVVLAHQKCHRSNFVPTASRSFLTGDVCSGIKDVNVCKANPKCTPYYNPWGAPTSCVSRSGTPVQPAPQPADVCSGIKDVNVCKANPKCTPYYNPWGAPTSCVSRSGTPVQPVPQPAPPQPAPPQPAPGVCSGIKDVNVCKANPKCTPYYNAWVPSQSV